MAVNKCDELVGKNGELVEFRKKQVLEGAKMRKYHCELWITKPDEFLIEADSIEEAKEKVAKIAAEKMKKGEKKVGQFIHEVDDDFEIVSDIDVGHKMGDER